MKIQIKKEFLILFVLFTALTVYISFQRTDRVHYELPRVDALDPGSITSLEVVSERGSVSLIARDGSWLIEPQGYPADPGRVHRMLGAVAGLDLTDLASESGSLDRYGFGDKERITVRAYQGGTLARSFGLGKEAPTYRHTFVLLPGDTRVFQARGSLRGDFDLSAGDLRDTSVLRLTPSGVTKITIGTPHQETTFSRTGVEPGEQGDGALPQKTVWVDAAGNEADSAAVESLLSALKDLRCLEYLDDLSAELPAAPELTVSLSGGEEHRLSLHPAVNGRVPATSSASASVFVLPEHTRDSIEKAARELAGFK